MRGILFLTASLLLLSLVFDSGRVYAVSSGVVTVTVQVRPPEKKLIKTDFVKRVDSLMTFNLPVEINSNEPVLGDVDYVRLGVS